MHFDVVLSRDRARCERRKVRTPRACGVCEHIILKISNKCTISRIALGHIWRVANGPRECSGGLGKVAKAMHGARMRRGAFGGVGRGGVHVYTAIPGTPSQDRRRQADLFLKIIMNLNLSDCGMM